MGAPGCWFLLAGCPAAPSPVWASVRSSEEWGPSRAFFPGSSRGYTEYLLNSTLHNALSVSNQCPSPGPSGCSSRTVRTPYRRLLVGFSGAVRKRQLGVSTP